MRKAVQVVQAVPVGRRVAAVDGFAVVEFSGADRYELGVQVGDLAVKSGVHISGMQYTQGASNGDLTEISLDARISGEYQQIMHFVNGLERSHTFFVIRAMAFTGQQGGLVNLRLRVSTWLRPSDVPSGLPPTPTEAPSRDGPAAQEGE